MLLMVHIQSFIHCRAGPVRATDMTRDLMAQPTPAPCVLLLSSHSGCEQAVTKIQGRRNTNTNTSSPVLHCVVFRLRVRNAVHFSPNKECVYKWVKYAYIRCPSYCTWLPYVWTTLTMTTWIARNFPTEEESMWNCPGDWYGMCEAVLGSTSEVE